MSKINNNNYNIVSVKTDPMVKMIQELSKIGVFKEKKKKPKKTKVSADDADDANDASDGDPNLFALRQIEPGMTQQQIEDIQQQNAAGIAALRAEVQQQRLADIEAQQGQRFADITRLGGIMNPILERFRGAQDPGAGQRIDPFAQTSTIFLPDIQEETFTETLNEGGPRAEPQVQTELFAEGEEEEYILPSRPQLQPRGKIGGGTSSRWRLRGLQQISSELGLGKIPKRNAKLSEIRDYYIKLTDVTGTPEVLDYNKEEFYNEIENILSKTGFKYSD